MADLALKDFAPDPEDRGNLRQSWFGSTMGQAAALVGYLIFYFGGLAALITFAASPYGQLRAWFTDDLGPAWGLATFYAVLAAPFVAILLFNAVPLLLRVRAERRAKARSFEAVPEPPASPFRLTPYGPADEDYRRLDGQEAKALAWLRDTPGSVFYLSGESGVGKSSLIDAYLVPKLGEEGWTVLKTRAFGDAAERLAAELRSRRDLFPRAPDAGATIRDLLGTLGDRRRKAGSGPLLVIVDQFEEMLILADPDRPDAFRALIEDLAARPLEGVKLLLVYRSDYDAEIFKLELPAPVQGRTSFGLGPYNQREAEAFLRAGGRLPSEEARERMFRGLERIEGKRLYRQITLNMVGLFLERMGDRLTGEPDKLIQGYLEDSLREGDPALAAARRQVLDALVSDAGTKQPRREAEIVALTGLAPHVARAVLYALAEKGLVRALEGDERTWEIAHDFLAALLGRAIGRARPTLWSRVRPALGPLAVVGWIGALAVGLPYWQQRSEAQARSAIEAADGSIHTMADGKGAEVQFDNERLGDCDRPEPDWAAVFRAVQRMPDLQGLSFVRFPRDRCRLPSGQMVWAALAPLEDLRVLGLAHSPVASLQGMPSLPALANLDLFYSPVASLQGMPSLPALASLDLRFSQVASLQGMPSLPALASLNLRFSPVASLQGMPSLPALASLDLSYSQVASLQGMPSLPALANLDLSNSQVASLQGMPSLPALANLDLSNSQVASLQGMPSLPALASLDLSRTPVASLQGMPSLPKLRWIDLRATSVSDLSVLDAYDPMPCVLQGDDDDSKCPAPDQ